MNYCLLKYVRKSENSQLQVWVRVFRIRNGHDAI